MTLDAVIAWDPGMRGIGPLSEAGSVAKAAGYFMEARRVAVVTGFYLPRLSAAETDGPPGAAALTRVLRERGAEVVWVTAPSCVPFLTAMGMAPVSPAEASGRFDAVVCIEAAGRAADGRVYASAGTDITDTAGGLDAWVEAQTDARVVAVGDGGNEIGMGRVRDAIVARDPDWGARACVVGCDALVVCGVSNWGAWALCAALGTPVSDEAAAADVDACVAAGCLNAMGPRDGRGVDGVPWEQHLRVLAQIRAATSSG